MTTKQAAEIAYEICRNLDGARFRDKQQCYAEVYYFVTKNTDQKFAFRSVAALRAIDGSARVCHLIAHGIGHGMYDKNPQNWKETIGKVSPECSYGEIHGILEAHSASGANPFEKKKLAEVCSKNPNWACFHGLGHIIVVQAGNDLEKAAALCYSLPKNVGQLNCLNGVFMEHMIGQGLEEHGIYTSERRKLFYEHVEEFEKLCSSQTRPDYIRACWTEIIHATSAKYKGNVDKIFAVCKKAQTSAGARGCRLHALAEIIPSKGSDPFKAKYICKIPMPDDPSFEKNCYNMISSVIIANLPSKIDEVMDFCSSLEKDFQNSCSLNVKRGIALLKAQDPEQASEICNNDGEVYVSICGNDVKDGYDSGSMQ